MKRYFRYLYLEIKRALKALPWLLIGAASLSLVTGAAAFCGYKLLHEERQDIGLSAALVVEDSSPLAGTLLSYIENMEGLKSLLSFERTDRETGLAMLKKDQVAAVFIVPENTAEGILDGSNTPAQIVMKKDASLQASLLRELTLAGARSLSAAQAGIYAVYDLYMENNALSSPDGVYAQLNMKNLRFFANRNRMFRETTVSSTGDLSVPQYYLASGMALLLLLWGVSLCGLLRAYPGSLTALLSIHGIGSLGRSAARTVSVFVLYLTGISLLLALAAALLRLPALAWAKHILTAITGGTGLLPTAVPAAAVCILAILLFASACTVFLYQCAPSPAGGVLLLFSVSVCLIFVSGGFIPPAFLPESIRNLGSLLPSSVMIQELGRMLSGHFSADALALRSTLRLTAWSALLIVLSSLACRLGSPALGSRPGSLFFRGHPDSPTSGNGSAGKEALR